MILLEWTFHWVPLIPKASLWRKLHSLKLLFHDTLDGKIWIREILLQWSIEYSTLFLFSYNEPFIGSQWCTMHVCNGNNNPKLVFLVIWSPKYAMQNSDYNEALNSVVYPTLSRKLLWGCYYHHKHALCIIETQWKVHCRWFKTSLWEKRKAKAKSKKESLWWLFVMANISHHK